MMAHFIDSEERQLRALAAMEGLLALMDGQPENAEMPVGPLASLIGLVFEAARDALPKAARMIAANNEDDD